jgi:hypothetical protein
MTPNPGSEEALNLGCICAVLDNNHGRFAPWPPNGWWITEDCPVHDTPASRQAAVQERGKLPS